MLVTCSHQLLNECSLFNLVIIVLRRNREMVKRRLGESAMYVNVFQKGNETETETRKVKMFKVQLVKLSSWSKKTSTNSVQTHLFQFWKIQPSVQTCFGTPLPSIEDLSHPRHTSKVKKNIFKWKPIQHNTFLTNFKA